MRGLDSNLDTTAVYAVARKPIGDLGETFSEIGFDHGRTYKKWLVLGQGIGAVAAPGDRVFDPAVEFGQQWADAHPLPRAVVCSSPQRVLTEAAWDRLAARAAAAAAQVPGCARAGAGTDPPRQVLYRRLSLGGLPYPDSHTAARRRGRAVKRELQCLNTGVVPRVDPNPRGDHARTRTQCVWPHPHRRHAHVNLEEARRSLKR
eukprot:7023161-Prymnesium_polylepis.1